MICRVKMFCCWWSFKPTASPVITMAIHTFVQWAFSYILFVATAARDQIHNILCCTVCVLPQSYSCPRRWLHSTSRGYHFAALTSFFATGLTFTILVVIIRVWFEWLSHQEITKTFGMSESHDLFALVNILQLIWWLDDGPIFVDNIPDLGQIRMICQLKWEYCAHLSRLRPVWKQSISAPLPGFVNVRSYVLLQIATAMLLICEFFGSVFKHVWVISNESEVQCKTIWDILAAVFRMATGE